MTIMNDERDDFLLDDFDSRLADLKLSFAEDDEFSLEEESFRLQGGAIKSLAGEYETVFRIDIETSQYSVYRFGTVTTSSDWRETTKRDFFDDSYNYVLENVCKEDQERVLLALDKFQIISELMEKGSYVITYGEPHEDGVKYYEARFSFDVNDFGQRNGLIMGVREMDRRMRYEMKLRERMNAALQFARSAAEAKSRFLYNMAHDIRTPLNAVTGFANMAEKHLDDKEKVADCLSKIKGACDGLLALVNDVLDVERIENGRMVINEQACDVAVLTQEIVKRSEEQAKARGLRLIFDRGRAEDTAVYADAMRLERMLGNVISNAVRYTAEGGEVVVSLRQTDEVRDGGVDYDFVVQDNGAGMSKECAGHIFDIFSHDGTSGAGGIESNGLGMRIAKSLVDLMGGTIAVDSQPGVGTCVKIHLRFKVQDELVLLAEKSVPFDWPEVRLEGKRVLLVDDNEMNREIAGELLREQGMLVEEADDGRIAVGMVAERPAGYYDFVLMDVQMPQLNGYEATLKLRALPDRDTDKLIIIAMTANAFDEDADRAIEYGMDAHLTKPISVPELLRTLRRFV